MARIRTIKPDFFTSLTIADLTYEARLTFIGLWTHVDDRGRCVDDARLVKAAVWPLDDRTAADVDADLWELADAGLVLRYTVEGRKFLSVRTWEEHQRISRPSGSKHPGPEAGEATPKAPRRLTESSLNPHGALREGSRHAHAAPDEDSDPPPNAPEMPEFDGLGGDPADDHDEPPPEEADDNVLQLFTSENTDSANAHGALAEDSAHTPHRKGKEGNREQGTGNLSPSPDGEADTTPKPGSDQDPQWRAFWARYPNKVSKKKARAAFAKALKKTTFDHLMAGLERYLTQDRRVLDDFVKDPVTWLNGDCWDDEPLPPRRDPRFAAGTGSWVDPDATYSEDPAVVFGLN